MTTVKVAILVFRRVFSRDFLDDVNESIKEALGFKAP